MAKQNESANKSEGIRQILKSNPKMLTKEVISTLGKRGIQVAPSQAYFTKGRMRDRKGRRKARQVVEKVATATGNADAVATILKVKEWAAEVGGMKKLKELVDALSE